MTTGQWQVVSLGEITDSMKNGIYRPASTYADDGVACLRMYNIDKGAIVWRDIKRMRLAPEELTDYELLPGDLLVNRVNSRELVGKAAVIPEGLERLVFESKNIRLRLKRDLALPKFVNYQLLLGGQRHFSSNAQQVVGMASISQKQLASFPVVLPPLAQQERIVAEIDKQFSRLDEAVTNLNRVKANLTRYKAAVLKAAVEGRLVETEAALARRESRTYETGHQLLQRILEARRNERVSRGKNRGTAIRPTESRLVPEGWAVTTLGSIATTASGGTPRRDRAANYGGDIPWVKSGELGDSVVTATEETLSAEGLQNSSAKVFPEGTLCIALYGATVGTLGVLGISAATNQAVCGIFPWAGIDTDYLRQFLEAVRGDLVRLGQGGAQPNISQEILRALTVPVPPAIEQRRIAMAMDRHSSILRGLMAEVDHDLERAQGLRRAILRAVFSISPKRRLSENT